MCSSACENRGVSVEALQAIGELRVALVSIPHTYYLNRDGIHGYDYALLREFCRRLDIELIPVFVDSRAEAIQLVAENKVHISAGLLPVSSDHDTRIRFGPSYTMLQSQVIYASGRKPPSTIEDLVNAKVETPAGGIGVRVLTSLANAHPGLRFRSPVHRSTEQLLARLNAGVIDYAVIPSIDFQVLRLKYPSLEIGFDLGAPVAAAWAISDRFGTSVDTEIVNFFVDNENTGMRLKLWHRYYGHYGEFDFVDARAFLRAYEERLPEYRENFESAADDVRIDWRLLAALSYQESHWDPKARSPTGVRGIMMLTRRTAKQLGVARDKPVEAIAGGAQYLARLIKRVPETVTGDDRLWFGLAAYNLGYGHVADARKLTLEAGRDPNSWQEVSHYVGLLNRRSVGATTRFGRARGLQTLHFVDSIRRYLDALRQLERREVADFQPQAADLALRAFDLRAL